MADPIDFSKLFNIPVPGQLDTNETILVIEDQQDLRLIITHQLQKLTFSKIRGAGNGYEAIEILNEVKHCSVIICDLEMPVMGGLDLLNELRERTDLERGPFCLSMDNVNKEKLMLAVENGVDEILVKPFTLADIAPKVRSAFKVFHNPKNPEKAYELAKSHLREKRLAEATKVYTALAQAAAKAARPVVGLARVAAAEGKIDVALKHLKDAEARNQNFVHTFVVRGEIMMAEKNWDEALKAFQKAISLSPLNPVRYKMAADLLFQANRYPEAISLLDGAMKHKLEFKDMHHYLSQGHFAMKAYDKAQRHVRSALSADPDNVVYLNQLGICLKELQNFEEATKVYNQIIKLDPENKAALYNKAVMLHAKGDNAEAMKLLERLLKKHPDFAQAKSKLEEYKKPAPAAKTDGAA